MALLSEVMSSEMKRGVTSRMLYPYPEQEKPYPVVTLDTTAGDMTLEGLWVQCGDPTSTGRGGESIYGPTFEDELSHLKHNKAGVVSMCNKRKPDTNGSQFYITLGPCPWLDGHHTIFAQVGEGLDVLRRMNVLVVNKYDRPNKLTKLIRTLVVERPRHYEWRSYAESYGCFNSKGSQLAGKVEPGISVRKKKLERGSFKVVKRVSAAFVKPTHQGGWELYRKLAF